MNLPTRSRRLAFGLWLAAGCGDDGAATTTTPGPTGPATDSLDMTSGSGPTSGSDATATTPDETTAPAVPTTSMGDSTTSEPTTQPTTDDPTGDDPSTDDGKFWSRQIGDEYFPEAVTAMAATDDGFVVSGHGPKPIGLGAGLVAEGGAFFARFGLDGSAVWVHTIEQAWVSDIAVGPTGEIVVAMEVYSSVDLGGVTFDAAGILLAKYSSDGTFMWGKGFGDPNFQSPRAVAVNAAGEILMVGDFKDQVDFGGGPLVGSSSAGFMAHIDGDGDHIWSRAISGGSVRDVAAAGPDFVVVGDYSGAVDFGDGPVAEGEKGFVVRYGADHAVQWKRFYDSGSYYWDRVERVAIGSDGVYVAGLLDEGVVDLGGGLLESTEDATIFLVKLAAAGTYMWSHQFGTPECGGGYCDRVPTDLLYNPGKGVIVTGRFSERIDFGGGPFTSSWEGSHIFAAQFDENGAYGWSRDLGVSPAPGIYETRVVGATDAAGEWFLGSPFTEHIDLGYGIHTSINDDVVLARLPWSG